MFNFGEHLKSIRKEKKNTQKQVAQAINITERNYQNYELNEKKPGFDNLIALADYFDVSLDYLVGRSDDPKRHWSLIFTKKLDIFSYVRYNVHIINIGGVLYDQY